jgi:hypothetical protein
MSAEITELAAEATMQSYELGWPDAETTANRARSTCNAAEAIAPAAELTATPAQAIWGWCRADASA